MKILTINTEANTNIPKKNKKINIFIIFFFIVILYKKIKTYYKTFDGTRVCLSYRSDAVFNFLFRQ